MSVRAVLCLGCNAPELDFRLGVTAPFVAARAFAAQPEICRVAQCRACGLMFFEDRFDDAEAQRLYADYRGEAYYLARHACEPWYTRKFNSALGGPEEMTNRRAVYANTIGNNAAAAEVDTVLDYGGDRGQLMQGGPGTRHFVFDISGVAPGTGVTALNAAALAGREFDLVLVCEVLEHVSQPADTLREAARHVRPGGLLYVTVPNREFPLTSIPKAGWYRAYLSAVLKRGWLVMALDFWSTGFRIKFGRVPPLGFAKLHEHVTFFDRHSLTVLLEDAGLQVLSCEDAHGLIALCRRNP